MAADDANPYWADPERRGAVLRPRPGDRPAPALLRHRPPRRRAPGGPGGVRRDAPARAGARRARGWSTGCAIDHPDGLADPAGYLERLRDGGAEHVWVEKILDPGEQLRDWPVEGTVGYEFLNDVAALFVDPAGEAALTALWTELSGDARPFGDVGGRGQARAGARRRSRPTSTWLRRLWPGVERLEEALAALPGLPHLHPRPAGARGPARAARGRARSSGSRRRRGRSSRASSRRTPPVMAKGVEDTAFYRYVRLLALNDVGGDPSRFGDRRRDVPRRQRRARRALPAPPARTQTHDTKRSGDVRARIGALAGMADEWAAAVRRLARAVRAAARGRRARTRSRSTRSSRRSSARGRSSPSGCAAYMEKAMREAQARRRAGSSRTRRGRSACSAYCRALYDHAPFRAGVRAVRRARRRARASCTRCARPR